MRYTATALSPLHIGSGHYLTPMDFVILRDALVVFDFEAFLADHPQREPALTAALASVADNADPDQLPALERLLTSSEQSLAKYHRYSLPTLEAVRTRLKVSGPPMAPVLAETPVKSVMTSKPVVLAPRRDLRGGLGSKPVLSVAGLPAAPPPLFPSAGKAAPTAVAVGNGGPSLGRPSDKPTERPAGDIGQDRGPERPPERFVAAVVRNSDDAVYLPGSALKGALRTALLSQLIGSDATRARQLADILVGSLTDWGQSPRVVDERVNEFLNSEAVIGRFHDRLGGLSVSDSNSLKSGDCLSVEMVRSHSPRTGPDGLPLPAVSDRGDHSGLGSRSGFGNRLPSTFRGPPLFIEAIRPRTQFSGRINFTDIRSAALVRRGDQPPAEPDLTVAQLCQAANQHARRVLEREYEHYRSAGSDFAKVQDFHRDLSARLDKADEQTAILSVGFGAGWHRVTAGLAIEALGRPSMADLRRRFNLASHRLGSRFPKSRRLAMNTFFTPRCPLGWLELRFG